MKTTKDSSRIERQRKAHHKALEKIALEVGCKTKGKQLWSKLRRIEATLYSACETYSNDSSFGIERWQAAKESARAALLKVFGGTLPKGLFLNGDPRGHMLKLDCDDVTVPEGMERDWGGNGILAATIE